MFSPLCDGEYKPQKYQDIDINITPLHCVHTILFISHIGDLLLSSIIGIQTMVKIDSSVKKHGKTYRDYFLEFTSSPICPQTIILVYERAKRRMLQEYKGVFKNEPTSNGDYNQGMEIEMEGLDGDEAEAIKIMALHGSDVPDYTWSLTRGYDYDWSKPTFPRNPDLWKTANFFN
jgi:hypothetical protein